MSERTQKEVDAEILALEGCKAYAPKFSAFGDNNHAKLDLQMEFLRGQIDTDSDEFQELSSDEQSAVMEAEEWEQGGNESPSSGWDFKKPKKTLA